MNGVFTVETARHLSSVEYLHYYELGLAPALDCSSLSLVMDSIESRYRELEEAHQQLRDYASGLEADIEQLHSDLDVMQRRLSKYESCA